MAYMDHYHELIPGSFIYDRYNDQLVAFYNLLGHFTHYMERKHKVAAHEVKLNIIFLRKLLFFECLYRDLKHLNVKAKTLQEHSDVVKAIEQIKKLVAEIPSKE